MTSDNLKNMIEISNGNFGYDNKIIVESVNINVLEKEITAIVGPSGCGKTTILKSISGNLPLMGGMIRLDGKKQNQAWISENIAQTLQNFPLFHWLTVKENLMLACKIQNIPTTNISNVLEELSALHLIDKFPKTLSGGERCRASLAQAVITKPKILLLDEPFTGLDLHIKEDIARYLFSFTDIHNTSIIFVTHDLYDACIYATRVIVLGSTTPSEIKAIVNTKKKNSRQLIRNYMLNTNQEIL